MNMRHLFIAAAVTMGALGLAGTAEAAKSCKLSVTGPRVKGHPTRVTAEVAAATVWSTKVAEVYTLRFANWANAENQSFSCSRYTTALGINAWRCRATANPCAYD
ncbi:MAG: hypothetical protein KDJ43_11440 [Rhizobiaceae bacterium]|nr:hypothetical protein [Rhizobiaceae bacterium]MCC0043417.1 hypothetical protein [Brucellaceae bacterium]